MPGTRCSGPSLQRQTGRAGGKLGLLRPRAAGRGRERGALGSRARRAPRLDGDQRRVRRLVHRLGLLRERWQRRATTSTPSRSTDALLAPFAGAAAFAVGMLVRSRVKPFQPTILLDGLIVSLAVGAAGRRRDVRDRAARRRGEHGRARAEARATRSCAAMLLAFSIWVIALIGWKPNRMWIAAAIGLALATIASTRLRGADRARRLCGRARSLDSLWLGGADCCSRTPRGSRTTTPLPVKLDGLAAADARPRPRAAVALARPGAWASSCRSASPR